ncbi:MAG: alanine racemase [Stomatobaculum sp.]|nr:alanine racemase [Stomatobaculum sp.]
MDQGYKRVYAQVDLDAVTFNMQSMRDRLPSRMKMAAVVKTDGYGHGAVPVAMAADPFVSFLCTASPEEALNLRLNGLTKPVLVLGPAVGDSYEEMAAAGIRPAVFTREHGEAASRAGVKLGMEMPVHLALDTGMNRIGMRPSKESLELAEHIATLPGVRIEGMFTHMYRADEEDLTSAKEQVQLYRKFRDALKERGIVPEICHVSNSAGIMELLGAEFDMARCGITMYGIYPSDEVNRKLLDIRPVMSLKSTVSYVKEIGPGDEVSYGGTYRADRKVKVATIPVGYGDGYPRLLSGKGSVLIGGKRAPILGRVCMDQFMVDVTDIPEARIGCEVTLMGKDGAEEITTEEIGSLSGRFPYELVCDIGKRVPRVYLKNGKIVGTKDYFKDIYEDFAR